MESAENSSKNVTLDDVRQALGDTDPHSTNASKLRAILGKGSNATIQRHLDQLRAEKLAAQQPVEAPVVPAMPDEWKALWTPVYTAAVATVRARLDVVVSERDALALSLATTKTDLATMAEQLDNMEVTSQTQAEALKTAQETAAAQVQSAQAALQAQTALLTEAQAALVKAETDAAHAAALAASQAALEKQTLLNAIERLTDNFSDVKAMNIAMTNAMAQRPAASAVDPAAPSAPAVQPQATKEKK